MSESVHVVAAGSRVAGIGSRLLNLAEAVWIARGLGCSVIVDWRRTVFLKDTSVNYFTEFFVPVPEILGVPIFYPPCLELHEYERATLAGTRLPPKSRRLKLDPAVLEELLAKPESAPRYLMARGLFIFYGLTTQECVPRPGPSRDGRLQPGRSAPDGESRRSFLADFYREVVPHREVARELDAWHDVNLRDQFVVGVNVATGNGLFVKDARYAGRVNVDIFDDEERFLRTIQAACERATQGLPGSSRGSHRIFYATDSTEMSEILGRLPGSVTRRTVFPPPGAGHHFCEYDALGYSDHAAAADTIIDMLLLARCHALVMNKSRFSQYALVTTGSFGGSVQEFEELYPGAE